LAVESIPEVESLTVQTLRGARWSYLSTLVNAALQILVTAILARLLVPAAFGLVAMAGLVLRLGLYFAQMGVGQAIVQREVLTRDHVRAGEWASILIGVTFAGLVWFAAPLISAVFGTVELVDLIRIMGVSFVLTGTSSVPRALLRRSMRFGAIAFADIVSYVVGYAAVGVALALTHHGVWSLVAAALCQSALSSILCNGLARPSIVPVLSWRPYRDLLGFGSRVSLISFLEFVTGSTDTLLVGRLSGATSLGLYSRAFNLAGLPMEYLGSSLGQVLLPSFSRIQRESARLGQVYLSVVTVFAGIGVPVALGMSGAARDIVAVLLGPAWAGAVPVMRIATLASSAAMLTAFAGVTLEATAHLREKLVLRLVQLPVLAALLFALGRFGLSGFAAACVISEVGLHVFTAWWLGSLLRIPIRDHLGAYYPGIACGAVIWVALYAESELGLCAGIPSYLVLCAQLLSGALILGMLGLRLGDKRVLRTVLSRTGVNPRNPAGRVLVALALRLAGGLQDRSNESVQGGGGL